MSEVKFFLNSTIESAGRGQKYLIKPPVSDSKKTHRGKGSKAAPFPTRANPHSVSFDGIEPYGNQVRTVLTNYYRFIGDTPRRRALDQQVKLLTRHYEELRELGYDIKDVTTFGLRHANALLAKWMTGGCGSNTVYCRWSSLRSWSRALGKNGMLGSIQELHPGFNRHESKPKNPFRMLTIEQVKQRSDLLRSKPDLTHYFVDRLTREVGITREEALQIEYDSLQEVIEGGTPALRAGVGNRRAYISSISVHLPLLTEIRDFMKQRNRETLSWSDLDLDAALQKYSLRLSYVTRTLFPDASRGYNDSKNGEAV